MLSNLDAHSTVPVGRLMICLPCDDLPEVSFRDSSQGQHVEVKFEPSSPLFGPSSTNCSMVEIATLVPYPLLQAPLTSLLQFL